MWTLKCEHDGSDTTIIAGPRDVVANTITSTSQGDIVSAIVPADGNFTVTLLKGSLHGSGDPRLDMPAPPLE